ncbi:MAG: hypothetical protein JWN88_962 [Frankiales bacterium]|jgi:hypothetical protein|nr:hypothetical protein [Frankiales bacterium]
MSRRPLLSRSVVRGAAAGLTGTTAMSVLMLLSDRLGLLGRQPPQAISDRAVHLVGGDLPSESESRALGVLAHLGFGVAAGGAYALLPARLPPVLRGSAWGLLVYAVSYQGWVPALGALPPASRDRRDRVAVMVTSHLVYGAVLGATERALRPER